MSDWLQSRWYVLAGVGVVCVGAFGLWFVSRSGTTNRSRLLLSFVLLWPHILDAERQGPKRARLGFVAAGIAVALALIVGSAAYASQFEVGRVPTPRNQGLAMAREIASRDHLLRPYPPIERTGSLPRFD